MKQYRAGHDQSTGRGTTCVRYVQVTPSLVARVWLRYRQGILSLNDVRDWIGLAVKFFKNRHRAFDPGSLLNLPGSTGRLERLTTAGLVRPEQGRAGKPTGSPLVTIPFDVRMEGKCTRRVPLPLGLCAKLQASTSSGFIGVALAVAAGSLWLEQMQVVVRPVRITIARLARWAGVQARSVQLALENLAKVELVETKDAPGYRQNREGQLMRIAPPSLIQNKNSSYQNQEGRGVLLSRSELKNPSVIDKLWRRFTARGWLTACEDGRQRLIATVKACLRVAKNPGGMLVYRASKGLWAWFGGEDEQTIRRDGPTPMPPAPVAALTADGRTLVAAASVAKKRGITFGFAMMQALGWDQSRYETALETATGVMR